MWRLFGKLLESFGLLFTLASGHAVDAARHSGFASVFQLLRVDWTKRRQVFGRSCTLTALPIHTFLNIFSSKTWHQSFVCSFQTYAKIVVTIFSFFLQIFGNNLQKKTKCCVQKYFCTTFVIKHSVNPILTDL